MGSYIVENVKIMTAKTGLRCYIVQKAKITYGWGLLPLKMLE